MAITKAPAGTWSTRSRVSTSTRKSRAFYLIWHVNQKLWNVRQSVDKDALFLAIHGKAQHTLAEAFGHIEITVRAYRKTGRRFELAIDNHPCCQLAHGSVGGNVISQNAARARSANIKCIAMPQQMDRFGQLLAPNPCHQ